MIRKLFKLAGLAALLASACAPLSLQAMEGKTSKTMTLDEFKEEIKDKKPSKIDEIYKDKLSQDSQKNPDFKKAALDALINWIQWAAIRKNFGEIDIKKLTGSLKKYVPIENQDETIKDILLVRTLFYPTKDEQSAIEKNTDNIKNKLLVAWENWKEWYKTYSENNTCVIYNRADFDKDTIIKTLSNLGIYNNELDDPEFKDDYTDSDSVETDSDEDESSDEEKTSKTMTLDEFKKAIKKDASQTRIDKIYDEKLNEDLKNNTDFKKAALDELIKWIQWAAIKTDFGITTRKKFTESLKRYVPVENQDKTIEDILLVRTLFYPTEEEKKDIKNNTANIKDKLLVTWEKWKEWYKTYSHNNTENLYSVKDFNKKAVIETLSNLGIYNNELSDLDFCEDTESDKNQDDKKFDSSSTQNLTTASNPTQSSRFDWLTKKSYFKPVAISLTVAAAGVIGFLM